MKGLHKTYYKFKNFLTSVHFCLSKAAIRRFKPLFDRILVEKFLPEVVRHFCFSMTKWQVHADNNYFSVVIVKRVLRKVDIWKCSLSPHPPYPLYSPHQQGSKLKLLMAEANQIVDKAKSAAVYAIMHTELCDSFFGRKPREVCFFQKKVLVRY